MSSEVAQIDGGSFRDPSGTVFEHNGKIYRTVNPVAAQAYVFARDNQVLTSLRKRGWVVDFNEVPESQWAELGIEALFEQKPSYLLEHPRVPFISYPYEWTFAQLKDAAIRHLDIQIEALKGDLALSDASSYNMQFLDAKPVHIDTLSFRPYQDGEIWVGYDQFCRHFLYPLLFEHYTGVAFNKLLSSSLEGLEVGDVYRLIPARRRMLSLHYFLHVVLRQKAEVKTHRLDELKSLATTKLPRKRLESMLLDMKAWIGSLSSTRTQTYWQDYAAKNSYEQKEAEIKKQFVGEFAAQSKPQLLIDLGGNTGEYATAALKQGAGRAIVVDGDLGALSYCYQSANDQGLAMTPVYTWLTDPSPDRGWNQSERKGFSQRAKADAVLALALVHHMAISGNVPLRQVVNWIMDRAACGVIEFVPKTDSMVKRMLATREDVFVDYSIEVMRSTIGERASITRELLLEESGRILVEYQLKG